MLCISTSEHLFLSTYSLQACIPLFACFCVIFAPSFFQLVPQKDEKTCFNTDDLEQRTA